jgi:hypothetical protein
LYIRSGKKIKINLTFTQKLHGLIFLIRPSHQKFNKLGTISLFHFLSLERFLINATIPINTQTLPILPKRRLVPTVAKSMIPDSGDEPIGSKKIAINIRSAPIKNIHHEAITSF